MDKLSLRGCADLLFARERYTVQLCQTLARRMVAGDGEFIFASKDERFTEQIEIKT